MEDKVIEIMAEQSKRTDAVNKRMFMVIVIMALAFAICVCAFCWRDAKISHDYFTQDYDYATYNNTNSAGDNAEQTNKIVNGVDTYGETTEADKAQ